MLFADKPSGNHTAVGVGQSGTEQPFAKKNAFRMMSQGSMTEVRKECLAFIEPLVKRQVVFNAAAVLADR